MERRTHRQDARLFHVQSLVERHDATRARTLIFLAIAFLVGFLPCLSEADDTVTLQIGDGFGFPGAVARVPVHLSASDRQPATIDFQFRYDTARLLFTAVEAGPVAEAAGKTVEGSPTGPDTVIVLATGGLSEIADGVAVRLYFKILPGVGVGEQIALEGMTAASASRDASALATSVLSGTVSVVQCVAPDTPQDVQASDGDFATHVRVHWSPAARAAVYQVYRSTLSDGRTAALLAEVEDVTFYNDYAATGVLPNQSLGCARGKVGPIPRYYYWVGAANGCGESALSGPDSGWCTGSKDGPQTASNGLPGRTTAPELTWAALALLAVGRRRWRSRDVR